MASSANPKNNINDASSSVTAIFDPTSATNTTFVQADPSTFRAVVQRLTGAPQDPATQKHPVTAHARLPAGCKPTSGEMGPRRSAFKLHERRQSARKLEIKLNNGGAAAAANSVVGWSSTRQMGFVGFGGHEMVMVSPVSPLDLLGRGSPRTPCEEEEKAIAEKGFYLHPSPLTTPRGSEPQLLPLFPLHSPRGHPSSSSSS